MDYKKIFSLDGKNIAITGGLGILGQEHVKGFLSHGAQVAIIDRAGAENEKKFSNLQEEYPNAKIKFYPTDLSRLEGIGSLVDQVVHDFGQIHGLLNNAASKSAHFFEPSLTFSIQDWREVMGINTDAAFFVAQKFAKHMVEHKISGSIVNVLSIYGLVGPRDSIYEGSEYMGGAINTPPVYSASKGALLALTKYFASTLGKNQLRFNALTPGGVSSGQNSVFSKKYSEHVPMGRQALPHEMVGAAIFLLSDASSYVNGHNLVVDGGWTAW
jgi:NAD(P)-dependent dehydrogenase (short-subunit alcohol dehydrogenase family)